MASGAWQNLRREFQAEMDSEHNRRIVEAAKQAREDVEKVAKDARESVDKLASDAQDAVDDVKGRSKDT